MSADAAARGRAKGTTAACSDRPAGIFRAPLLPWAIGLIGGIWLNSAWPATWPAGFFLLGGGTVALGIPRLRLKAAPLIAVVAAAGAGMLLHHRAFRTLPENHIAYFAAPQRTIVQIEGSVVEQARVARRAYAPFGPWLHEQQRTSLLLAVESIDTRDGPRPTRGLVRVTVGGAALDIPAGTRLRAVGWLSRPRGPRNPGGVDWANLLARRGMRVYLHCDNAACVRVRAETSARCWFSLTRFRDRVRRLLVEDAPAGDEEYAAFLETMVLGVRGGMDPAIEEAFTQTGCAHYLAVSGVHVVMLAAAVWLPALWCGATRRSSVLLVLVVVAAYTLLADPRPPILRAALMIAATALALLLRRPPNVLNAMCLAAILLLLVDPCWVFDVGFQLSFLAVLGILYSTPLLRQAGQDAWIAILTGRPGQAPVSREILELQRKILRSRPKRWWNSIISTAAVTMAVSVAAWLATLPVVAATFGRVPLAGWLHSAIAAVPVTVVMLLGFLKIPASLTPAAGEAVALLLEKSSRLLLDLVSWLARLPHDTVQTPSPPGWLAAGYYAVLLLVLAAARRMVSRRVTVAAVAGLLAGVILWWSMRVPPDGLRMTQLAVGRGTATVLELPDGGVWLYDVGASGSLDPGAEIVVPYLNWRGIRRLDGIIISHANLDHFGGVPGVLDAFRCPAVYVSAHFREYCPPGSAGEALLDELARRSVKVVTLAGGDRLTLGRGVEAEILWPPRGALRSIDVNDDSLVIRLTYARRSILLTGDIGDVPQAALVESGDVGCDVLVLPHHGAMVATTPRFLDAADPAYLVRSSFVRDVDSPGLADAAAGRMLLNTAEVGAIEVLLTAEGVSIRGTASPRPEAR